MSKENLPSPAHPTSVAPALAPPAEVLPRMSALSDAEEDAETEPIPHSVPFVTYTLLALIALVFAVMYKVGHGNIASVARAFGNKDNDLIRAGQVWRFLTAVFLHGNLFHLAINSLSLVWLGSQIERIYGWRKYLLIFLFAGFTGNVFSFALSKIPSLGASGAIFGLVGAGIVFPLRFASLVPANARAEILRQLITVAVVNLCIGFGLSSHVDNWAHLGGLIGGGFIALFLLPEALADAPEPRLNRLAVSAAVLAALGITVWAGVAQWRWAILQTEPPLYAALPAEPEFWWSVGLPEKWQHVNWKSPTGTVLIAKSPDGAVVTIMDMPSHPRRLLAEVIAMRNAGAHVLPRLLADKPAYHVFVPRTNTGYLIDLYLVQAFDKVISLRMDCPIRRYATAQPDFERTVLSLRILHTPPNPDGVKG